MSNRSINYKLQFSIVFVCLPGRVVPAQLFFVSFSPGNPTIWNQSQGDSTLARKALADTLGKQVRTLHIWTGWWLEHEFYFSHHIGNFHPSQLTFTPSFFRGVGILNHQPVLLSHYYPIIIHRKPY